MYVRISFTMFRYGLDQIFLHFFPQFLPRCWDHVSSIFLIIPQAILKISISFRTPIRRNQISSKIRPSRRYFYQLRGRGAPAGYQQGTSQVPVTA